MDYTEYLRFALAFVFVIGLIGLFGWLAKRFGVIPKARRGEGRRLSIVEVTAVDAKRRLVLVRRDRTEHLIMLGATADLVIECGIPAEDHDQERGAEVAALSQLGGGGGS
jgi:flagellar protein FliO/FliZ